MYKDTNIQATKDRTTTDEVKDISNTDITIEKTLNSDHSTPEIISEKTQSNDNSSMEIQNTPIINQTNTINSEESSPLNKNPVSYIASKDGSQLADVPADGNCFYIALTLSLILPAIQDENDFAKRVKLLWPEVSNMQLEELKKELIQHYCNKNEKPETLSKTPNLQASVSLARDRF